ncbi:uncharacterized protein [Procambarus clarkii]|uniref:uncharacterized protein isoform X2 n=1 Tax=Procambarus clarkii TaxID=6728 RepID=UPI0037448D60
MSERANTQSPGPPSGSWMVPPAQKIPPLVGHEHNSYIPGEERYPLHPSMVQPHHSHSSYSTEDVKCILPHYPPPLITHLSSTTDQQHPVSHVSHQNFDQINFFKGCGPSPKFSRPPPSFLSVPPDFSKPPPSVSYDRNIPQSLESPALPQSQQSSIMSTSMSYHSPWHSGPPPQICNSQFLSQTSMDFVSGGMAPSAHAVNSTGVLFKSNPEDIWEDEDMKWLREFQQRIKNRHQPQPPAKTVSKERTVKKKLKELTTNFQDESYIQDVKMLVNQRRMKRRRMKKNKKLLQVEKKAMEKRRQEEERKIDAWREKLELEEVEKRREKAFKAEADSILGEVRQKQNDVLRMQQLLEALITLRLTRINKGAAHGYISSTKSDQHFASTLKGIGEVVRSQMKEYELEEQTLCVMMEESASHQSSLAGNFHPTNISRIFIQILHNYEIGLVLFVIQCNLYYLGQLVSLNAWITNNPDNQIKDCENICYYVCFFIVFTGVPRFKNLIRSWRLFLTRKFVNRSKFPHKK